MFKSTVTGSASTTAVVTIPGAAVLTPLSDEDILASPAMLTTIGLWPRFSKLKAVERGHSARFAGPSVGSFGVSSHGL